MSSCQLEPCSLREPRRTGRVRVVGALRSRHSAEDSAEECTAVTETLLDLRGTVSVWDVEELFALARLDEAVDALRVRRREGRAACAGDERHESERINCGRPSAKLSSARVEFETHERWTRRCESWTRAPHSLGCSPSSPRTQDRKGCRLGNRGSREGGDAGMALPERRRTASRGGERAASCEWRRSDSSAPSPLAVDGLKSKRALTTEERRQARNVSAVRKVSSYPPESVHAASIVDGCRGQRREQITAKAKRTDTSSEELDTERGRANR